MNQPNRPLLVVLTGINGAGKDTLAPLVVEWLDGQGGLPARFIYAPRVTPAAALFQDAVLQGRPQSRLAEMLGYFAQHAESDQYLAELRRREPQHLVINRGPETAYIYNAVANQLTDAKLDLAYQAYDLLTKALKPTITILLDVDLATSRARSAQQMESDHIQDRDDAYFRRMIAGYHELAATRPGWVTVDARADVPEVLEQIKAQLKPFLDQAHS